MVLNPFDSRQTFVSPTKYFPTVKKALPTVDTNHALHSFGPSDFQTNPYLDIDDSISYVILSFSFLLLIFWIFTCCKSSLSTQS